MKTKCSRGELDSEPSIPLCSMPAPGPALIQHIMSKLLLAAAPIETLIKAIRGSSWGGAGGCGGCCEQGVLAEARERDGLEGERTRGSFGTKV